MRWASRGDVRRKLLGPAGKDLSPTDVWLLAAIDEQGPVRVSDLAAWQGVDKSTTTTQVRRLEVPGLVVRKPDPADRRAVLLTVTPRGRRARRRMAAAGAAVIQQILEGWSDDDRQTLGALLTRLADQLDQHRPS